MRAITNGTARRHTNPAAATSACADRSAWNTDNKRSGQPMLVPFFLLSGSATAKDHLSGHTQTSERCSGCAATLVRQNPQLKHGDVAQVHVVLLSLPYRPRRAKIPLLADNFSEGTPV